MRIQSIRYSINQVSTKESITWRSRNFRLFVELWSCVNSDFITIIVSVVTIVVIVTVVAIVDVAVLTLLSFRRFARWKKLWKSKKVIVKSSLKDAMSNGLVVTGEDSCSGGRGLKYQHWILDGHFYEEYDRLTWESKTF